MSNGTAAGGEGQETMTIKPLPSLDHFTREELVQLVGVLHRTLMRADRSYTELAKVTTRALDTMQAVADSVAA
jgi:hypothetical protein